MSHQILAKDFNSIYRRHVVYGALFQSIALKEFWNNDFSYSKYLAL